MHIAYKIIADGTDVTGNFQDRLVSMTIIDEAGEKSDCAEIVLDDRDYLIALPKTGAKLQIALGLKGQLVEIGILRSGSRARITSRVSHDFQVREGAAYAITRH